MTMQTEATVTPRYGRSFAALLLAFIAVAIASLATDQLFHVLHVYPAWGEPMHEPSLNVLALSYRLVYGVLGGYIAARLAPRNPMRHAMIIGGVGFLMSTAGAVATIPMNLAPAWFPIALVVTSVPCAWLGGVFARAQRR